MTTTINVEVLTDLPLDDGGTQRVRQIIEAHPTGTPGLVVFPALTGFMEIDDSTWHITHVPSGRRIPASFGDRGSATAVANALGTLGDWTSVKPTTDPPDVLRLARDHGAMLDARWQHLDLGL